MINELIEKEIEKLEEGCACGFITRHFRDSLQTIAKEVAMRFKEEPDLDAESEESSGYNQCVNDKNDLADQIINEVSK